MKIIVLSLYIFFLSFTLYSQCDTLRNETHIFWCEEYTLQFSDFQDTSRLAKHLEWCESKSLCWGAYTGLFSVMDIPKKEKDQQRKEEVIYFAPAFELKTSYRLTSDSLDYLKQIIVFDMYELAARKCRIQLDSLYKTNPTIGIKGIFFKSVEIEVNANLGKMVKAYTNEVYIQKLEGSFLKWRTLIDNLLNETKEFQTTTNDRLRFIQNKPIIKGYIKAPKVIGNLFEK